MKYENVMELLRLLDCRSIMPINRGWVTATCPFAPYSHARGKDTHPSFGIRVRDDTYSLFKCHCCGRMGSLFLLARDISIFDKTKYDLRKFVHDKEATPTEENKMGWVPDGDEKFDPMRGVFSPVSMEGLEMPKPLGKSAEEYVASCAGLAHKSVIARGIPKEIMKLYNLGYDAKDRKTVFPIYDWGGNLVGIQRRGVDHKEFGFNMGFKKGAFYGEREFTSGPIERDPFNIVFLVEGPFDVMYLRSIGYNSLGLLGKECTKVQLAKLDEMRVFGRGLFFNPYIFMDGDKAETNAQATEKLARLCEPHFPVYTIKTPEGRDPDQFTKEEIEKLIADAEFRGWESDPPAPKAQEAAPVGEQQTLTPTEEKK
jgi:hypothetical protein